TFCENVQILLEDRNISQKDFASMLNIAKTTLNGYIKSNHEPDFETVKAMARALNVSTDCLLGYTSPLVPSSRELLLIERLRQLTPEQRNIVYDLVMVIERRSGKK
ncbi:MAG: helix-turn-helix domain-containing protein, partial [Roseburia sp.]